MPNLNDMNLKMFVAAIAVVCRSEEHTSELQSQR